MNAIERKLIFVNFKGSDFVHAVLTPEYYNIIIQEVYRAPVGIYEEAEYHEYNSAFTYTTLNQHLPFLLTPVGGFRLAAVSKSKREIAIVKFHQECLAIYHEYHLPANKLWFDYINDQAKYSIKFKDTYDRFTKDCIPSIGY